MRRHAGVVLIVLIALSVLVALWSADRKTDHRRLDATASQLQPIAPDTPHKSESSPDAGPPVPSVKSTQDTKKEGELKKYLMSQHPAAIETRIEKRDSFISRYRLLGRKKVLLSSEESHELDDILRDREKWNTYQEYLQKVDFRSHPVADEQMYRLFLLQYFESSVSQHQDPELLEFLMDFVLRDNFGPQLSTEVKKSLAYEKIKVLGFLSQLNPESLDLIKQRMTGLRHEKLLRDFFENPPAS